MFGYDVFGAPLIFHTDSRDESHDRLEENCQNTYHINWHDGDQRYWKKKNPDEHGYSSGGSTSTSCSSAQCVKDWFDEHYTARCDGCCIVFVSLNPDETDLPIDCIRWPMGAWSEWSDCKDGKMTRTRSRSIKRPAANGGVECVENLTNEWKTNIYWDVLMDTTELWKPCDSDKTCTDPNRKTKSDGSCSATCKSGYDFDETDLCVAEESGSNKWTFAGIIGGIGLLAVFAMK